jgi:hypothetical protein
MHRPINVKSPNNISEWQMGFNSVFKGLIIINLSKARHGGSHSHVFMLKISFDIISLNITAFSIWYFKDK